MIAIFAIAMCLSGRLAKINILAPHTKKKIGNSFHGCDNNQSNHRDDKV